MYSTLQRLNHFASISTTFLMVLLGLVSLAGFLAKPAVDVGVVNVHDLIVQRGRMQRWRAKDEDIARLKFDVKTDLTHLLTSYNTKQLYLYLTASYQDESVPYEDRHEVVLWDRIMTRGEVKDFRAVGIPNGVPRTQRSKLRLNEAKSVYTWRNPSGSFKDVHEANVTLHYSLMPYVGMVTSGVAATAQGLVEIPEVRPGKAKVR